MKSHPNDEVLERNVETLLVGGGEPPRISDAARTRIKAHLIEATTPRPVEAAPRRRAPLIAIGLGLAATAAIALIVTRMVGGPSSVDGNRLADGTSWIAEAGSSVDVLGARRVRVHGAALLDVAPGAPFVVETARGTIEVLGTRFLVAAEAERTTAAVVRGSVKLASSDGTVVLHAGEQGVAEPGRPPSRGPAPRLSHLVSWAAAARRREEHAIKPLRNGTLFAREPNNPHVPETPLPIARLGIDVVVENQVARVALDQTFQNKSAMALEGNYRFAIPPDAALQRLAMYVDGRLTESAVVERMRARRIYEDVVYRRLDPALLEWAGTGRLALRVYPLPAFQDKRIVLSYTQSLPRLYDDWTLTVPLPEVDLPVGEVAFDVRVKGCANCELASPSHRVTVRRQGEDAIVAYRGAAETIGDSLVLHVRDTRAKATTARDGSFVMVRARPELPKAARPYAPRTWVILDDVSASRDPQALRAQADLVDGFLRELDEDDRVAVIAFDVAARTKLAPTRVMDADRKAVRAALRDEGGVGATDVGAAIDAALALLAGVPAADARIVYLGDGEITAGARQLDALRARLVGKAQFVGVGVGDGPDTQTLGALAAATGGYATTIDLADDVGWRAFDLVAALHTARVTGLEARLVDAGGAAVPATLYVKTEQLADGEELELVGKLAGTGAPVAVELTGQVDGSPWHQRVALGESGSPAGYLPRLWAQRHIAARLLAKHEPVTVPPCAPAKRGAAPVCATEAELREQRDEAIRQEVVALGKQYFLLSRHTSLLVLEDDAMYAKYDVAKGTGDTWAPYPLPARIPVLRYRSLPAPTNVAADAELVRTPLPVFINYGYGDVFGEPLTDDEAAVGRGTIGLSGYAQFAGSRADLQVAWHATAQSEVAASPPPLPVQSANERRAHDWSINDPLGGEAKEEAQKGLFDSADAKRQVVTTGELSNGDGWLGAGRAGGGRFALDRSGKVAAWAGPMVPARFSHPGDPGYDDLTTWVPALFGDAVTAWQRELAAIRGGSQHTVEPAAAELLRRARAALPSGQYRWGDLDLAVDGLRRIGWRRTLETNLVETGSLDGRHFTRRYGELGLDVVRSLRDDDIAVSLAYLPILLADPDHYAHWFDVRAKGRRIELSRARGGVELAIELDARDRVVAISRGDGRELARITWDDTGPTAAVVDGEPVRVGFTGAAIANAVEWAHTAPAGVVIELPGRMPAYWVDRIAKLAPGTAEWRHATRQHLAALAATGDRNGLLVAYEALRAAGTVERGDLVLAGSGIVTGTRSDQLAAALAPHRATSPELVAYFERARGYQTEAPRVRRSGGEDSKGSRDNDARPRAVSTTAGGLVGAVSALREVAALANTDRGKAAVDRLIAIDGALALRVIGASLLNNLYRLPPEEIARAWDSVAIGDYTNLARAQAALVFANRGNADACTERVAALVDHLDLAAPPPALLNLMWQVQSSRRGPAGAQLIWASWRDRALAGSSFEHVIALVPATQQHPIDLPAVLARAAQLAGGDRSRLLGVASLAIDRGQAAWAQTIVAPLLAGQPTRPVLQLAARLALAQGRTADALGHLEAAQAVGADEPVGLSTIRGEVSQIIGLARQLATQSVGAAKTAAIARAMDWVRRWRAIDPGNPQIDQTAGELMLAVGDPAEAWRQLSTVIERDPMSGDGYQTAADAFERQGRVEAALELWQQAIVIDQTNPTPRMRKAQALIALGRTAEGDALLAEIAHRTWHVRHDGVLYQVRALLERAKQPK